MPNELPPISGMGSEQEPPPARVESIAYYNPSQFVHRPGILTAVAIVCIIFSGLAIIVNLGSLLMTGVQSRMAVPIPPTPATLPAAGAGGAISVVTATSSTVTYGTPPPITKPSRMSQDNRDLVITALNRISPISPRRQRLLDQLLNETGDDPFPFNETNFSDEKVTAAITSSGLTTAGPAGVFFITPNGRIEISNDSATYAPAKGQSVTVTTASTAAGQSAAAAMPAFGSTVLSFSRKAVTLVCLSTGFELLLAIYLMMIAIRSLWDHPRSRRMYLNYVALKFPAIAFTAVAGWIWTQETYAALMPLMPAAGMGTTMSQVQLIQSAIFALFYCLLPTAILIVMSTRGVRRYYQARIKEVGG